MDSMIEIMKSRKSWRTFEDRTIEPEKRSEIESFINGNQAGPFGSKVRFVLVDIDESSAEDVKHLGTYGTIEGAKLFLVGCAEKTATHYIDFGYAMERNILFIEKLGLNTCWMGVTFDKAGFGAKLKLKENEELIACSPVGYAKNKRRLKDLAMRKFVSSDSRLKNEKLFFENDLKTPLKNADAFAKALECVRMAPSASNRQPWRLVKQGDSLSLILEYTPGYQYKFGQIIDMGIAMLHFELACSELGLKGAWKKEDKAPCEIMPQQEYIATWK